MTFLSAEDHSEHEALLQLLYVCPVGLMEFDPAGVIHRINPAAVNLIAPDTGAVDASNVFALLDEAADLSALLRSVGDRIGLVVADYPLRLPFGHGRQLAVTIVRVDSERFVAGVRDDTLSAVRERMRAELMQPADSVVLLQRSADRLVDCIGAAGAVVWSVRDGASAVAAAAGVAPNPAGVQVQRPGRDAWDQTTTVVVGTRADLEARYPQFATMVPREVSTIVAVPVIDTASGTAAGDVVGEVVEVWFPRPAGRVDEVAARAEAAAEVVAAAMRRARSDERLQASEKRFRSMFDSIDEGFCVCEIVTDAWGEPVDYRFLEVNPLFEEMTGLVDPVGRTALQLVPDLESLWVQTYARVGLGGETLRFEQGSAVMGRWFDVFAMPLEPSGRFGVVFKDVTARRHAELALQRAARADHFRASLGEALLGATDPLVIQVEAARLIAEQLDASGAHYTEFDIDATHGTVTTDSSTGLSSAVGRYRFDDLGAVPMAALRAGEPAVVHDVRSDERLSDVERERTSALGIGAYVLMPVQRSGVVVAALAVHHRDPRRWTQDELGLIADTARRTWSSIERLRAEQAVRRTEAAERQARQRAEWLTGVLAELDQHAGVAERAKILVERLVETHVDYATVEAPGAEQRLLAVAHHDPDKLGVLRALREHHALADDDANSAARAAAGESQLLARITAESRAEYALDDRQAGLLEQLGPRSHIAVPLDLGGRRGTLLLGRSRCDQELFEDRDLEFAEEIANRVGVLLASAGLREEEHDISLRLQQALLPDRLVEHSAIELDACYAAASNLLEVGGDWYDSFSWPDGQIGVCVGDVVGHSIESTASMGRLRSAAAALATQLPPSPAALLQALDRCARGPNGTSFATACCAVLDPHSGVLTYSSAGHPPIVLVDPSGHATLLDDAKSPPLCVLDLAERTEATLLLEPESMVILYSDGLVERRGETLDQGFDRLMAAASTLDPPAHWSPARSLVEQLGADAQDDVVVACLRYVPVLHRFECRIDATPDQFPVLRNELRTWIDTLPVVRSVRTELLLAVGEATTNAIEHAYLQRPTRHVDVEVTVHHDKVRAQVRDRGRWRPDRGHTHNRGRGTSIMTTISSRYGTQSSAGGTTVTLHIPLPAVPTA